MYRSEFLKSEVPKTTVFRSHIGGFVCVARMSDQKRNHTIVVRVAMQTVCKLRAPVHFEMADRQVTPDSPVAVFGRFVSAIRSVIRSKIRDLSSQSFADQSPFSRELL